MGVLIVGILMIVIGIVMTIVDYFTASGSGVGLIIWGVIISIIGLIIFSIKRKKKKAIGISNTKKWNCNAVGNLPSDAEAKTLEILQKIIIKNGVTDDFIILRKFIEEKNRALNIWGTRYKSSKGDEMRLFFLIGKNQDYTDLGGKKKNGDICAIEFDFYLVETSNEVALTIGNEAEQEIKKYLSSGLTLRQ